MPSNADIILAIGAQAEANKVDMPETDGLNNNKLAELLSGLKADAEVKPKVEAKPKLSHVVCKGKAVTTKRGILAGGKGICAKDLPGGDKAITALVKSKYIEKA